MARDYKPRTQRKRARKQPASPLRLLLAGFAMGVVAAVGVYFLLSPAPPVAPDRPVSVVERTPPSVEQEPGTSDDPPASARQRQAARPSERSRDQRFDFYEWLPNFEVVIPESDEKVDDVAPTRKVEKPGAYILQAGSFRSFTDADRMKARLALQGIESQIQKVTIGDDQTWHRVRVGPITQLDRVNRLRTQLREQNIDVLLLQVAG